MVKPFALTSESAREGRLFCPRPSCPNGYSGWIACTHRDCPKDVASLVERKPAAVAG